MTPRTLYRVSKFKAPRTGTNMYLFAENAADAAAQYAQLSGHTVLTQRGEGWVSGVRNPAGEAVWLGRPYYVTVQ